tara:strand:+ start:506 stop:718 length:213 start_codon:yes stop_codon:yes gene_type:complete
MADFLEIKCLKSDEQRKILEKIKRRITKKRKDGLFTEREIREIEEMKLHPLADILDVQNVYEDLVSKKKI